MLWLAVPAALLGLVALLVAAVPALVPAVRSEPSPAVRILAIRYLAHDGRWRRAYVVVPRGYGPGHDAPLPLVISPHGRGATALGNVRDWGRLPALGRFAVVSPEGQGRRLGLESWGAPGDIRDLIRMPAIVEGALPWLRVDRHGVYAVGNSMGGQEVLLLLARDPSLLSGVVAFDATADLALRYHAFAQMAKGLQKRLRDEVGGTPRNDPHGYAVRSPLHWAARIAFSGVPLQLWWSRRDRVIREQRLQCGRLYRTIVALNPAAPVVRHVGVWTHGTAMRTKLPAALRALRLLPPRGQRPHSDQGTRALLRSSTTRGSR